MHVVLCVCVCDGVLCVCGFMWGVCTVLCVWCVMCVLLCVMCVVSVCVCVRCVQSKVIQEMIIAVTGHT